MVKLVGSNVSIKVAIVHDYLNQRGGAERVVGVLHEIFPEAPIYTLFVDENKTWPALRDADVRPSMLQRFSFIERHFKLFFWLYPFVISTIRIKNNYDVVISSSSAYAKGIRLPKRNRPLHVCYCHTPMRFAWNFENYIQNEARYRWLRGLARLAVPFLKLWDRRTSKHVDIFLANSTTVQRRIKDLYRRDSKVVFPPVDEHSSIKNAPMERTYFLVVSRLVSYKRIDLAVQACTRGGWKLIVIGEGPDRRRLEAMAGPSISFIGWQSEETVTSYMAHCDAFVFPGEEDFGITPVEVNLLGRPVVAYGSGGATDTIIEGVNGLFFESQSVEALTDTLRRVQQIQWDSEIIRKSGRKFEKNVFSSTVLQVVTDSLVKWRTEHQEDL